MFILCKCDNESPILLMYVSEGVPDLYHARTAIIVRKLDR